MPIHDFSHTESGAITSGENISYWISSSKPTTFETLDMNIDTDILVIGGGIGGLTTAYCLAKAGKKTVLVEDGLIGSGETGRTTAHLTYALDDRYYYIEKAFGEDGSRKAGESHIAAWHDPWHFGRFDHYRPHTGKRKSMVRYLLAKKNPVKRNRNIF